MAAKKENGFKVIFSLTQLHKKYLDTLADREQLTRNHVIRLIISDYIKRNPTGKIPRITKEVEDKLPQQNPLQEIVDEMPTGDISTMCDHAGCTNRDTRPFNLETINEKNDIELELRLYCPTHFVEASNNGDKLELLE